MSDAQGLFGRAILCGGSEDVFEEGAVDVTGEEAGEFGAEPVCEAAREFLVSVVVETVEDEGTEEDLAAGVFGALLFGEAGFEGFGLSLEFGEALFDGFAGHGKWRILWARRAVRASMLVAMPGQCGRNNDFV